MTERYTYPVLSAQVVDGDTYRLELDPGFRLTTVQPVRLDGWDTPEKHPVAANRPGVTSLNEEVQAALEAQECASYWFHSWGLYGTIWCRTRKDPDSFGRWLGSIWGTSLSGTDISTLGEELFHQKLATRWPKRWWQEYLATGQ